MDAEFNCLLCLEIFTGPVKMTDATWPCPKCRAVQNETSEQLTRNYNSESIIQMFKSSRQIICENHDLKKKLCKSLKISL